MATVEQLKQEIAQADAEVARLTPAYESAKTAEAAAKAARDAAVEQYPVGKLLRAKIAADNALAADPGNPSLQTAANTAAAEFTSAKSNYAPFVEAYDASVKNTIAARSLVVDADEKAAQADLAIARIDPTQASPEAALQVKQETEGTPAGGDAPVENTDGTTTRTGVPVSNIDSATNISGDPTIPRVEVNDDGSTTTFYEDGSTLTEFADGTTSATDAPPDTVTIEESPTNGSPNILGTPVDDDGNLNPGWVVDDSAPDGYSYVGTGIDGSARTGAATSDDTSGQGDNGDTRAGVSRGATPSRPPGAQAQWAEAKDLRVKLRVPNEYLKGPSAGPANILQKNGGILFPYTPTISVENQAQYASQSPLHSNYAQYFYKNSAVSPINLTAKFTVQNEFEGAVLLGVIHLLRSLTKMKWGNDPDAGSPPPICRFDAYGDYMLFNVPVAIASWRHELPDSVDYITIGRPGSPTTYGRTMVPVLSTINITMNVMYSRREMLEYNVKDWLSGGLRYRGYI
jgi:hypothetical protein